MIRPVARLPDKWIEQAAAEGAHIDLALKSPWQLFAAWDGSAALGFVGALLTHDDRATIRGWYVFPDHRGAGVGSALLLEAVRWCGSHGHTQVEIRTARRVEWAGFEWTGYERTGGNQERHYRLHQQPSLPLGTT